MFAYRKRPKPEIDKNEPVTRRPAGQRTLDKNKQKMAQRRTGSAYLPYDKPRLHPQPRRTTSGRATRKRNGSGSRWFIRTIPNPSSSTTADPTPDTRTGGIFSASRPRSTRRRAPRGKLDQYDPALNAIIGSVQRTQEFIQATTNRQQQLSNMIIHSIQTQTMINQQNSQAFMNAMTQQHQNFMASQQRSFQISQQNATAQMDRQTQQAHNFTAQMNQSTAHTRDYQDILLDQQYYVNPQSGETSTVSGRFNHTFVNGPATSNATSVVQTDSNFNPNGAAGYNWTELMPTHH